MTAVNVMYFLLMETSNSNKKENCWFWWKTEGFLNPRFSQKSETKNHLLRTVTPYINISVLFMWIQNLVTIFMILCESRKNLNVTEKTSHRNCVCRQHYSLNNHLFSCILQTGATFECTFEDSNTCTNIWENVNPFTSAAAQLQWTRDRGPTQTLNTGPNVDHTIGNCKSYISVCMYVSRARIRSSPQRSVRVLKF